MRKMSNSSFKGQPWTRPIIPTRWRHSRPNPLGLNFPILPQKPNQLSLRPCGNPRPRPPHTLATGCGVKKGAVLVSAPIRGGVLIGREVTLLIGNYFLNTRWRIINNLAGFLTSQKFSEFCLLSNILNFGGFLKVLKHVNSTITFNDLNFGGVFLFSFIYQNTPFFPSIV